MLHQYKGYLHKLKKARNKGLFDKVTLIMIAIALVLAVILVVGVSNCVAVYSLQDENIEAGRRAGVAMGDKVGIAKGTVPVVITDLPQGYIDGAEEGLSAKDITVDFQLTVRDVGKLEVLNADFKAKKLIQIGNQYSALYVNGGEIIFTVDLTKAVIREDGADALIVVLPRPVSDIHIDDSKTELLGEWSTGVNAGSAESGYKQAVNERNNVIANAEHEIVGYADLMQSAKDSAAKNVELILESVSISKKSVTVVFDEESEG